MTTRLSIYQLNRVAADALIEFDELDRDRLYDVLLTMCEISDDLLTELDGGTDVGQRRVHQPAEG